MNKLFLFSLLFFSANIFSGNNGKDTDQQIVKPAKVNNETIINHSSYICSYNTKRLTPNYVAWVLTKDRVNGNVKRSNNFQGDPSISANLRVETSDYSGSGYDRGHMCPAADNRHSQRAMEECFYMTNICPQNHQLNTGTWNDLEIQCREWVKKYNKIYIVSGPIYNGTTKNGKNDGKYGNKSYIGKKKKRIEVPDAFFKVLLVMSNNPKGIGYIMPNQSTNKNFSQFSVSIDEVERQTGLDFFPALTDNIENKVESKATPL